MRHQKLIILVCILLVVAILGIVALQRYTINGKLKLSLRSEKQLHQFLEDYDIVIPDELKNMKLKWVFEEIEKHPHFHTSIDILTADNFYENVRNAVKDYYGVE